MKNTATLDLVNRVEKMKLVRERRRSPRYSMELPVEFRSEGLPFATGGIAINGSEMGFLMQTVKNLSVGNQLRMTVLFPTQFELSHLNLLGEVVWKDLHCTEDWQGYLYGLRIVHGQEGELKKLRFLLDERHLI